MMASVKAAPGESLRKPSRARTIGIASAIWGVSIFLSRIMGLVREQIIGRTLGASREADLYFASFTLPDFLNYLLAAGALSIVFIPMFLEYFGRDDRDGGWQAFSAIANFLLLTGSIGIALLMVFARPLAAVVGPGFTEPSEVDTLVRLIRIILPAQIFHCRQRCRRGTCIFFLPRHRSSTRQASSLAASPGPSWGSGPMASPGGCSQARHLARSRCLFMAVCARTCAGTRSCRSRMPTCDATSGCRFRS